MIKEKNKEVKSLKQFIDLGGVNKDFQISLQGYCSKLEKAHAELSREKAINNILISKGSKEQSEEKKNQKSEIPQKPPEGKQEITRPGSSTNVVERKEVNPNEEDKPHKRLCKRVFLHGKDACEMKNCKSYHQHGKNRGVCFAEFLQEGSCKFGNNCHFNHDFPAEVKDSALYKRFVMTEKERIDKLQSRKENEGNLSLMNKSISENDKKILPQQTSTIGIPVYQQYPLSSRIQQGVYQRFAKDNNDKQEVPNNFYQRPENQAANNQIVWQPNRNCPINPTANQFLSTEDFSKNFNGQQNHLIWN